MAVRLADQERDDHRLRFFPLVRCAYGWFDRHQRMGVMQLDEKEFLWNMYNEQVTQGRHHETQRTAVTTVVLALAGAVISYLGFLRASRPQWPMSVFLIILGLYGAAFSYIQTQRSRMHIARAAVYRHTLEYELDCVDRRLKVSGHETCGDSDGEQHDDEKRNEHRQERAKGHEGEFKEDPRVTDSMLLLEVRDRLRVFGFFIGLNLLVAFAGLGVWLSSILR